MAVTHLNPASMPHHPEFTQGAVATGARTVYVGGQNGTDADGAIAGDLATQTELALRNVISVLAEAGAAQQDVVKLTVYLAADTNIQEAFAASQEVWGHHVAPTTVLLVAGFARPEALVEIEAIAVLD